MKPVKISDRNVMFTEPMGEAYSLNIGLIIGEQYNYIIDTGVGSGSVSPIIEYLGNTGRKTIIVNTHAHYDHIWGNWVFQNDLIISHIKCQQLLVKYWDDGFKQFSQSKDGEVKKCLPNLTFEKSITFPNDGIKIFYTPGHSIDSISVYDEIDKVMYAGDNIGDTNDSIIPKINTDLETFKSLIDTYKKYDFNLCISGHNKPQEKNVISIMENFLEDSWKRQNST